MSAFLWGFLGGVTADLLLAFAAVLAAPRLFRAAMRRQAQTAFGRKPAGTTGLRT